MPYSFAAPDTQHIPTVRIFSDQSARQNFAHAPLPQQIAWTAQAAGLALSWFVFSLMSPDRASASGRRLLRLMGPHLERTVKIKRNLKHAFPDKSDEQIEALSRDIWGNMGAVLAEYPHLRTIGNNRDEQRIEVVVKSHIQAFEDPNKPSVFLSAHLGNWEIAAAVAVTKVGKASAIHAEQNNPLLLDMLQRRRQALGCGFVSKEAGLRPIVRLLEKGTSIGIIPDQKIETGEPVPFFGTEALTTTNPARLALKYQCELVPIQVERLRDAHFRVTFHAPITPDDPNADKHTQALQMTRSVNALFESWIRNRPGQWWCPKNRWPKPQKQKLR